MAPVKLYYMDFSSPCRAVKMTANALGVELELIFLNLLTGENKTPEFLKINPQHSVPTLLDGDFMMNESRAMLQYLANAYGKDDSLYPKDPKKRAMVDQRLFFDATGIYDAFMAAYYVIFLEQKHPEADKIAKFDEKLEILESYLSKTVFSAGDNLTIADFAILASLTTAEATGHNMSKYSKIQAYKARCIPLIKNYEEANGKGAKEFADFVNEYRKQLPAA